jgi:hypothetical protein
MVELVAKACFWLIQARYEDVVASAYLHTIAEVADAEHPQPAATFAIRCFLKVSILRCYGTNS